MAQSAPLPVVPIVQTTKDREKALSDEIRTGLLQALEAEVNAIPAQTAEEEAPPDEKAVDNMPSTEPEPAEQKKICFPSQGAKEEQAFVTPHGEKDVQYINVLQLSLIHISIAADRIVSIAFILPRRIALCKVRNGNGTAGQKFLPILYCQLCDRWICDRLPAV